jgi:hypothetical protein
VGVVLKRIQQSSTVQDILFKSAVYYTTIDQNPDFDPLENDLGIDQFEAIYRRASHYPELTPQDPTSSSSASADADSAEQAAAAAAEEQQHQQEQDMASTPSFAMRGGLGLDASSIQMSSPISTFQTPPGAGPGVELPRVLRNTTSETAVQWMVSPC